MLKSLQRSTVCATVHDLASHVNVATFSTRHFSHDSFHSNIGQDSGGGYLQTGHRRQQLFDPTLPPRVLVTGASGQIGSELVPYLRSRYGEENVIASDVKMPQFAEKVHYNNGLFVYTDVTDYNQLARVVLEYRIDWVFHLAALLSAVGEKQPQLAMKINNTGVENILGSCIHFVAFYFYSFLFLSYFLLYFLFFFWQISFFCLFVLCVL